MLKRQMLLYSTLALSLLVITGCGNNGYHPTHVKGQRTPVTQPLIVFHPSTRTQLTHIVSSKKGTTWLWGPLVVWYRANAKATWHSVSPSHLTIEEGWAKGQRGWFGVKSHNNSFVLYHTKNGGLNWKKSKVFPGELVAQAWPTSSLGFLLTTNGTQSNDQAVLWTTNTGGASWQASPISFSVQGRSGYPSGITFASPTSGWITGSSLAIGTPWLFQSKDGGHHWAPESLPLPADTRGFNSLMTPQLKNSHILIPATLVTNRSQGVSTVLYTKSPGHSWQFTHAILLLHLMNVLAWDIQSAKSLWVVTSHTTIRPIQVPSATNQSAEWRHKVKKQPPHTITLWHSVDGGRRWVAIKPIRASAVVGLSLDMVSSVKGYLVIIKAHSSDVLYTKNGGANWQQTCM